MRGRVAVVGGANVDIGGLSAISIVKGDSNPGRVRISAGGVGRNIAEGCARLGLEVQLVTAMGRDTNGDFLRGDCARKGIGLDYSLNCEDLPTSVYLFIDDADGDMYCAVNDMEIQARLTPEVLSARMDMLNACRAVVLDANLPVESIEYLAMNLKVPIFADTVSVAKAGKLKGALPRIHCLKTNRLEAALLTGINVIAMGDAERAAAVLNRVGVRDVCLTLGERGVVCVEDGRVCHMSNTSDRVVNATGAGDAFMAALVWSHIEGCDLKDRCIAGMAAAAITVEAEETVSPEMNRDNLIKRMAKIKSI